MFIYYIQMYTYTILYNPFVHFTIHIVLYFFYRADTILHSMKMFLIAYISDVARVFVTRGGP